MNFSNKFVQKGSAKNSKSTLQKGMCEQFLKTVVAGASFLGGISVWVKSLTDLKNSGYL